MNVNYSAEASVSGELDVGLFSGKLGIKMSASGKNAREFFSSGEGVMMINQAHCVLHQVIVNEVIHNY